MRYVPQAFNGYYRPAQGVRLGNIDAVIRRGLGEAAQEALGVSDDTLNWVRIGGGVAAGVVATLVIQRFLR